MPLALVVDDSKVDQHLAGKLLESRSSVSVMYAGNGIEALAAIERQMPNLVLTDMQMPEMDGLQFVEAMRKRHPAVPVILMTAHGSEEVAAEALRKGAASYVPKKYLSRDLAPTVERMLALADVQRQQQSVLECLRETECVFVLDNNAGRIQPLIGYLRQDLGRMKYWDETDLMRVGVALDEALSNAIQHGNLEVSSELREAGMQDYVALLEQRRTERPYCNRHVHVTARVSPTEAAYTIRDEGVGFNRSELPDPTDPANLEKASGRGLFLIHNFMDEVRHNEAGNEITLIKRHTPEGGDGQRR